MKKWMILAISVLILAILGAGLGYKYIYNKPHRDYDRAAPDFILSSAELFSSYLSAREDSENLYNGKVIQISGKFSSIEQADSLHIIVFALQEGMFGDEGIRCTLLPGYVPVANALKDQEMVTVKGYCTGYNDTDVIMVKCSIVN